MEKSLYYIIDTAVQNFIIKVHKKYKIPVKKLQDIWNEKEESKPNMNGRLLEYYVASELGKIYNTTVGGSNFENYKIKYNSINEEYKKYFQDSAEYICKYFKNTYDIQPSSIFLNPDKEGRNSVSGDISLHFEDNVINISLKNNNFSCKHQRPMSFMNNCGVSKIQETEYKNEITKILQDFYNKFSVLKKYKEVDKKYIKKLYSNINDIVIKYIEKLTETQVKKLFYFITGIDPNLVLVINKPKFILLYTRPKIKNPTAVDVSIDKNGYVNLYFSNGCLFTLRLHTAESTINKVISLKYDTKFKNMEQFYSYIKIKK